MRFLFVDHIQDLIPGKMIRGTKTVNEDDPFLYHHREDLLPHFASSLIGETLGQLAAWNVMHVNEFTVRPVAGIVAKACSYRRVYPGDTLHLESHIDHLDSSAVTYHSVARVNHDVVFTIEDAVGPLLPMESFIDPAIAREQFESLRKEKPVCAQQDATNQQHNVRELFSFDNILPYQPNQPMIGEKYIAPETPYFCDHFPNRPVLPLTVLLECIFNLAQHFLEAQPLDTIDASLLKPNTIAFEKIKMKAFVPPGSLVRSSLSIKEKTPSQIVLQSQTTLDDKRICHFELTYQAEKPHAY